MRADEFEAAVETCYAQVLRGLIAVAGERARAEDAMHDALVDAMRPPVLEGIERVDAWLYAVGVRKLRRSRLRQRLEGWLHANVASYPAPGLTHIEVMEVLAQLTARQREVIVARYYLGLSFREVASALGISVGAATSTASQAARRVRLSEATTETEETVWTNAR